MLLKSNLDRRTFLSGIGAIALISTLPRAALALSTDEASSLVQQISGEVTSIVNSAGSESAAFSRFEQMFNRYADVPVIARSVMGAPWRQANSNQRSAFVTAFRGYLARKYGRQFRSYRGANVTVTRASDQGNKGVLVSTQVNIPSQQPFNVDWQVSDRSGAPKMINLYIEGVSMLSAERSEIQSILEANRNSVDALIADLKRRG